MTCSCNSSQPCPVSEVFATASSGRLQRSPSRLSLCAQQRLVKLLFGNLSTNRLVGFEVSSHYEYPTDSISWQAWEMKKTAITSCCLRRILAVHCFRQINPLVCFFTAAAMTKSSSFSLFNIATPPEQPPL